MIGALLTPAIAGELERLFSEWRGIEFYRDEPKHGGDMNIQHALRQALLGHGPLPDGFRFKRPKRQKYRDLQALRARRGVGRPAAAVPQLQTDLVRL